jgi:hypothetical protein
MSWASAVRRRQGRVQRACADSLVSPAVNPRLERAVDVSWSAIWLSISRAMWISALLDVSISKSSRPRGCLCGGEPWRYLLGQQPFCSVQMLRTKPATFMLGQSEYFVSNGKAYCTLGTRSARGEIENTSALGRTDCARRWEHPRLADCGLLPDLRRGSHWQRER